MPRCQGVGVLKPINTKHGFGSASGVKVNENTKFDSHRATSEVQNHVMPASIGALLSDN